MDDGWHGWGVNKSADKHSGMAETNPAFQSVCLSACITENIKRIAITLLSYSTVMHLQFFPLPPKAAQDEHVYSVLAGQLSKRHAGGLPLLLVPATPLHRNASVVGHILLGKRGFKVVKPIVADSNHFICTKWLSSM